MAQMDSLVSITNMPTGLQIGFKFHSTYLEIRTIKSFQISREFAIV